MLDVSDRKPLPFVNISAGKFRGTTTDIAGFFTLTLDTPTTALLFSFVGYESAELHIDSAFHTAFLTLLLNPSDTYLDEVVVKHKRHDRVREIMRQVLRNKRRNRPESFPFFRCQAYRKVVLSPVFPNPDAHKNLQDLYKKRHFGLMETASNLHYTPAKGLSETVDAVQASGLKYPRFALLTNQLPFFSFYQESFRLAERTFFSPVAKRALAKYNYQLRGTLFDGTDSVFVIAYQPKENRNFDALQGLLYINQNGYAIQNVIAMPSETDGFAEMTLAQQYRRVNHKWFPEQIAYTVVLPGYPSKEMGVRMESKSYLSDVSFEEPTEKTENFNSPANIRIRKNAFAQSKARWKTLRRKPLDSREVFTYRYMDSLSKKPSFRLLESLFNSSLDGLYPLGPLRLRPADMLHYNAYEGLRPGLSLQTGSEISERFTFGAYVGIGLRDQNIKYALDASLLLSRQYNLRLSGRYAHSREEPAMPTNKARNFTEKGYVRRMMAARMDDIRRWRSELSWVMLKKIGLTLGISHNKYRPLYPYRFADAPADLPNNYTDKNARLNLQYTPGGSFTMRAANQLPVFLGRKQPLLYFDYSIGTVSTPQKQQIRYSRYQLSLQHTFVLRGGLRFSAKIESGYVGGNPPYRLLFHGPGASAKNYRWLDMPQAFRTMGIYEFLHSRFVHLFFKVGNSRPLFKIGPLAPHLFLLHSSAWGKLDQPNIHQEIGTQQAQKGFHEAGLQIHNLLNINYLNITKLGFGFGVYYRHGLYAKPKTAKNLAYRLLMKFLF